MLRRVFIVFFCTIPAFLVAQNARYTFIAQDEQLSESLQRLVNLTRIELAYDPELVAAKRAFCLIRDAQVESILTCVLRDTGLDFYRLSSGTYVLARSAKTELAYGAFYGQVEDETSGTPLPFASVLLADAGIGVQTNREGFFSILKLPPGDYDVLVTYIGYTPHRQKIQVKTEHQTPQRIVLRPEPTPLLPVIIEGLHALSTDPTRSHSDDFSETLASIPLSSANTTVETTATLQGIRKDAFTADIHLQGGDTGDHITLIDGTPVFLPLPIAQVIGSFSPYAIGKVNVQKAGFGVSSGSALAGIIAYEQILPLNQKPSLKVQASPLAAQSQFVTGKSFDFGDLGFMITARTSLSSIIRPTKITNLLQDWSASDPLVASSALILNDPETFLTSSIKEIDTLNIPSEAHTIMPQLQFSDLHAAFRIRWRGANTIRASFYRGGQAISGLPHNDINTLSTQNTSGIVSANRALASGESYQWSTSAMQIKYQAILTTKSLLTLQGKLSRYDLLHAYNAPISSSINLEDVLKLPTNHNFEAYVASVIDGNNIAEQTIETTYEWLPENRYRTSFQLGFTSNESNLRYQNLPFQYTGSASRWHGFIEQHIQIRPWLVVEGGLRGTFFMENAAFFPEPRLTLLWQPSIKKAKRLISKIAIGQYRQYLSQIDLSTYSTNSFLPSLRVWIPTDAPEATVYAKQSNEDSLPLGATGLRIPAALHIIGDFLLEWKDHWTFRSEAYYKRLSNVVAPNWLVLSNLLHDRPTNNPDHTFSLLTWGTGKTSGWGLMGTYSEPRWNITARYDWAKTRYQFSERFGGRAHPTPWSTPHRLDLRAFWRPFPSLSAFFRWQAEFGRTWGYRRIYYDDLSNSNPLLETYGIDLTTPEKDKLPAFSQADLGFAYLYQAKPFKIQFRFDALNITNRKNTLDWQLIYNPNTQLYEKKPRYLIPFLPSFSIQITR